MQALQSEVRWFAGKQVQELPLVDLLNLGVLNTRLLPILREDILENGLHYPLIVIRCTVQQVWERAARKRLLLPVTFLEDYQDPEQEVLILCGGGNRKQVAEELGYDAVSCIVLQDFDQGIQFQKAQQGFRLHLRDLTRSG